jgi:hypothetical protein
VESCHLQFQTREMPQEVEVANRITQDEYDELFKFNKRTDALKHALEIRKFEIELYWKRAAYFWTFIGAAFAGYGAVEASTVKIKSDLTVPLACLGFIFSFGWFCVNKGSKQWQQNWENHVDLLEDEEIGPLYRIVLLRGKPKGLKKRLIDLLTGPAALSVSRINQLISLYVTLIWIFLLWSAASPPYLTRFALWRYAAEIVLAVATGVAFLWFGRTSLGKHYPMAYKRETRIENPEI